MSSITQASAALWSHAQVRIPFLQDATSQPDELFAVLPFIGVDGPSLQVNMVDVDDPQSYTAGGSMGVRAVDPAANPGTDFTAGSDTSAKDAYDTPPAAVDPPYQEFFLKQLVGDVDMSTFLQRQYANANDLRQQQIDMKLQVLRYQFSEMMINGVGTSATTRDFGGLTTLVSTGQTRTGTGVLESDLDALEWLIRARVGKADYFLMDFLTFALYLKAIRTAGVTPELVPDPISPGARRVAHNGIPIYRSHHLFTSPATYPPSELDTDPFPYTTTIYCGTLGVEKGGLVGLYEAGRGSNGVLVEDVGGAQDAYYRTTRVSWACGLALCSNSGLAAMTQSLSASTPFTV